MVLRVEQGLKQHSRDMNIRELLGDQFPTTRWVMPQAHNRRVTVFGRQLIPAGFNIRAFPFNYATDQDDKAKYESAREANAVITHERVELIRALRARGALSSEESSVLGARGRRSAPQMRKLVLGEFGTLAEKEWANQRILLGGFSQGGVMALLTGLTNRDPLGGVFVLSRFLPMRDILPQVSSSIEHREGYLSSVLMSRGDVLCSYYSTPEIYTRRTCQCFVVSAGDSYMPFEDATASVALLRSKEPNGVGEGGVGLHHLQCLAYPNLDHAWFSGEVIDLAIWMSKVLQTYK
ncbi:BQ5605_C002g00987 [Microbotryum silenes-dioicae]|uniref:Acyl-protein thioesterase 1 n=1 Tax=Microbotryum silenes-dioicae TaxID=796604 RepID=A0A2X0MSD5_9BASI|nr:BQ5605_C002g00987 [Microbotryum silenes-dioicae]